LHTLVLCKIALLSKDTHTHTLTGLLFVKWAEVRQYLNCSWSLVKQGVGKYFS